MNMFLPTCAALFSLALLLPPVYGGLREAAPLLSDARSVDGAISVMQEQIASHPIVLLVDMPADCCPDGRVRGTVLKSYRGTLVAGAAVMFQPLAAAPGKQAKDAYILAMGCRPLEDGSVELQDCLIVPRYSDGSLPQTAMHCALRWSGLIKNLEEDR